MPDVRQRCTLVVFRVGGVVCAAAGSGCAGDPAGVRGNADPGGRRRGRGLVNLRGGLVTVIDGHRSLGQPRPADGGGHRWCSTGRQGGSGSTVDEVRDFLEVPRAGGRDPGAAAGRRSRAWCRRWASAVDDGSSLLDLDALLAPLLGG